MFGRMDNIKSSHFDFCQPYLPPGESGFLKVGYAPSAGTTEVRCILRLTGSYAPSPDANRSSLDVPASDEVDLKDVETPGGMPESSDQEDSYNYSSASFGTKMPLPRCNMTIKLASKIKGKRSAKQIKKEMASIDHDWE